MRVKNTGKKTIGLGTLVLPPDGVGDLPDGYGQDHPTVKFYLAKKWLVPFKGKIPVEQDAADEDKSSEPKGKNYGRMNLEQLRGEAFALGVEVAEGDTKAMLVQKITEKIEADA